MEVAQKDTTPVNIALVGASLEEGTCLSTLTPQNVQHKRWHSLTA